MNTRIPCYKCVRRSQICHASCTEYTDWLEERKQQTKTARRDDEVKGYARQQYIRMTRRR